MRVTQWGWRTWDGLKRHGRVTHPEEKVGRNNKHLKMLEVLPRNENPANPIWANVPYFLPFYQRPALRYPWARQVPLNQRRNTLAQLNFPRTLWITAIDSYFKSRKTLHLSVTQIDNSSSLLSPETCAVTEHRFTAHSSQGALILAARALTQGNKERRPSERGTWRRCRWRCRFCTPDLFSLRLCINTISRLLNEFCR